MSFTRPVQLTVHCLQFLVTFLVHMNLHLLVYSSPSCSSGLEYDCKSLQGNGTACIWGCNTTVTKHLSPGHCLDDCCKYCFSNCQECFYVKILSFCIHGSTNSSFTNHLLYKTFKQSETLEQVIRTSVLDVLSSINQTFKIELLQSKWYSKSYNIIQVYVRITSRKKATETVAIDIIRNATKTGHLGRLTVSPDVFEIMAEKDYDLLMNNEGEEDNLDVVELIAACIGALIILAAICWRLFYMCTTPHQRNRCNPCCRRTRINA